MKTRTIGSLSVSEIGLGCMNMSMGYGKADDKESARLLNEALDVGYTFLDTAQVYGSGHNEELIGKSLEGRRGEYVLATKCGLSREGINGERCVRSVYPRSVVTTCAGRIRCTRSRDCSQSTHCGPEHRSAGFLMSVMSWVWPWCRSRRWAGRF